MIDKPLIQILSLFLFLSTFILPTESFAKTDKYGREYVLIKEGDSLEKIALKHFRDFTHPFSKVDDYINALVQWNPILKSAKDKLKVGTKIYILYPGDPHIDSQYIPVKN